MWAIHSPRKIICAVDAPEVEALMRLFETQSKRTLGQWALRYAEEHFLPVYAKSFSDARLRDAMAAARAWYEGAVKMPEVREWIDVCHAGAKAAAGVPAAQAAARAAAHAVAVAHTATHTLGVVVYGATALVYDRVGVVEPAAVYDDLAARECEKMRISLQQVAVAGEPNRARCDWSAMTAAGSLFCRSYRRAADSGGKSAKTVDE